MPYNPFDEEFCSVLEYHLSKAFAASNDKELKWFWCDGISPPDDYSILNIIESKEVETKAWVGKNGQDVYEMTLKLGYYSLKAIKNQTSLIDCLPPINTSDWINILPEKKTIYIDLL